MASVESIASTTLTSEGERRQRRNEDRQRAGDAGSSQILSFLASLAADTACARCRFNAAAAAISFSVPIDRVFWRDESTSASSCGTSYCATPNPPAIPTRDACPRSLPRPALPAGEG